MIVTQKESKERKKSRSVSEENGPTTNTDGSKPIELKERVQLARSKLVRDNRAQSQQVRGQLQKRPILNQT